MKPWRIILAHFYLAEEKRIKGNPAHFGTDVKEYDDKNEAIREYIRIVNEWMEKSYDYKNHSMAAWKMYHEFDDDDIMTNILLHHNGEEYMDMTDLEMDEAMGK